VGISLFGEEEIRTGNRETVQENVEKFIQRCTAD
jgi:hypothetical protein